MRMKTGTRSASSRNLVLSGSMLQRVVVGALLLAGCGDRDARATPEGIAHAYVRVFFGGDKPGLRRIWATPVELDEVWSCDSADPANLKFRAASDLAQVESGLFPWETEVRFVEWDAKRTAVAAGETWEGCSARRDVVLEDGDVGFAIRNPEHPEWTPRIEHHGLTLLHVGRSWRIVRWSP